MSVTCQIVIIKTKVKQLTSFTLLNSLFDSFASPVLTYGCEIWGVYLPSLNRGNDTLLKTLFKDSFPFQKLHIRFCKQTFSIYSRGSNFASRAELGRLPIAIRICRRMTKYWIRLLNAPDNSLIKQAYQTNITLLSRNKPCRLKTLASTIQSINISQFNNITQISSESTLINNITIKLIVMFK